MDMKGGCKQRTITLGYRELPGLTHDALVSVIERVFTDLGLELSRICSFTADGAAVMGTCLRLVAWVI